jgi:uncharacterized protein (TIGR03663 family)
VKLSSPDSRSTQRERFVAVWLLLLAITTALLLRTPQLEVRPMHTDETTQAIKYRDLLDGEYVYDPLEHHGPTLLFATRPMQSIAKAETFADLRESDLRWVPLLFGLGLVVLVPIFAQGLGWLAVAWAALFLAVSPLFVFYSRYYIMEMLLAFFSFTALASGWRFYLTRNAFWLGVCAISFGLMHATKETFVIHVAGMIGGICVVALIRNFGGGLNVLNRNRPAPITKRHWILFLSLAAFTSAICFSIGFTNLHSIVESFETYLNYLKRAGGQGHEKPWFYYLQLLGYNEGGKFWLGEPDGRFVWTEAMVLVLACFGGLRGFFGSGKTYSRELAVFLAVYALATFMAYSWIAYKTPWCILSTHVAILLLAGLGAASFIHGLYKLWGKWMVAALLLIGSGHLALQSYRANFQDDPTLARWLRTFNTHSLVGNPYAYGFTPVSLRDSIVTNLEAYAARSPEGRKLRIEIATPSGSWPLPWYLRKFTGVAYLPAVTASENFRAVDPTADVILVDPTMIKDLPESVRGPTHSGSAEYANHLFGMLNQQYWIQGFVKRSLLPEGVVVPPPPAPTSPQPSAPESSGSSETPAPSADVTAPSTPADASISLPEPTATGTPLPNGSPEPTAVPEPASVPTPP